MQHKHRDRMGFRGMVLLCLFAVLFLVSCTKNTDENLIPSGQLREPVIRFQYAIYFPSAPVGDPMAVLSAEIKGAGSLLKRVDGLPDAPDQQLVAAHLETDVKGQYAPPDMDYLSYFGRGLTREEGEALQKSEHSLILDFAHPGFLVWDGLKTANEVTLAVAQKTGGLLWDESTREVFSREMWQQRRVDGWSGSTPDVGGHTAIHVYKNGEFVRGITLGMAKFGVPDVVVEDFSWSFKTSMGGLINLLCQVLAEDPMVHRAGNFSLKMGAVKHEEARKQFNASLEAGATGEATLVLQKGTWEEGDPDNRLIEIGFDSYEGPDTQAKQASLLSSLFGSSDEIVYIDHTEALLTASNEARKDLPDLCRALNEGLAPGERILLKAPFNTPDGGHEWMWVEVLSWKEKRITGTLQSEPYHIPTLRAGQKVEINEEDVFDYIRYRPDGTVEGNTTGAIIEKMQQGNSG